MNYKQSICFLQDFANFEQRPFQYRSDLDLTRVKRTFALFGHPEKSIRAILVAGTKGKGATANFIFSIFQANHYRSGLFTSPHLHSVRERIQLNGKMISQRDFARLMSRIRNVFSRNRHRLKTIGTPTYYEILALLAALYFREQQVDCAVLEIGMGGRLDAANIFSPVISVVTPISFDHEQYLGDTLAKIACEKAAVVRPRSAAVLASQPPAVKQVLEKAARRQNTKVFYAGRDFSDKITKETLNESYFDFWFGKTKWKNLKIQLPGGFQIKNAATALAAICILNQTRRFSFDEKCIRAGLAKAFWPGRFELAKKSGKQFVIDGAHNDASMKALVEAIGNLFSRGEHVFILGTSRDKNLDRMLAPIRNVAKMIVVTKSKNPRAQEPRKIIEKLSQLRFQCPVLWAPDLSDAIKLAVESASLKDTIVIAGSLFLAGEARRSLALSEDNR